MQDIRFGFVGLSRYHNDRNHEYRDRYESITPQVVNCRAPGLCEQRYVATVADTAFGFKAFKFEGPYCGDQFYDV